MRTPILSQICNIPDASSLNPNLDLTLASLLPLIPTLSLTLTHIRAGIFLLTSDMKLISGILKNIMLGTGQRMFGTGYVMANEYAAVAPDQSGQSHLALQPEVGNFLVELPHALLKLINTNTSSEF